MFIDDGSGYNLCDYSLEDILADTILLYILNNNYKGYIDVICYKFGYNKEYVEQRVVHLANSLKVLETMESMKDINVSLLLAKKEIKNWN